jgi:hypothetical protein
MTEVPKQVEQLVRHRKWTRQALAKATAVFPPLPEPELSSVESFQRAQAAQREAEEWHEQAVRAAMFELPNPPREDALRDFNARQQAGRRRARRRGRRRL